MKPPSLPLLAILGLTTNLFLMSSALRYGPQWFAIFPAMLIGYWIGLIIGDSEGAKS